LFLIVIFLLINFQSKKLEPVIANKILPGARNFDEIQQFVNAAKKDKIEKLRQKNKW
jgi:hypothetical protein